MVLRLFILLFFLFILLFPIYSEEIFLTIFIDKIKDSGNAGAYVKTMTDFIKENIIMRDLFIIVTDKNNADYLLSPGIEVKEGEIIITMKITGISTRAKEKKIIINKSNKEDGIDIILEKSLDYIHREIFPFEVYCSKNMPFFTSSSKEEL